MHRDRMAVWLSVFTLFLFPLSGCKESPDAEQAPAPPALEISPQLLDFGNEEEQLLLVLENLGQGILEWDVSTDSSWIAMDPPTGQTDSEETIRVRVERTSFTAGTYEGILDFRSNGGNEQVRVALEVEPLLRVDREVLDFGMDRDEIVFHVANDGTGTVEQEAHQPPGRVDILVLNGGHDPSDQDPYHCFRPGPFGGRCDRCPETTGPGGPLQGPQPDG